MVITNASATENVVFRTRVNHVGVDAIEDNRKVRLYFYFVLYFLTSKNVYASAKFLKQLNEIMNRDTMLKTCFENSFTDRYNCYLQFKFF